MGAAERTPWLCPMLMNWISRKFEEKFVPMFKPGDKGSKPASRIREKSQGQGRGGSISVPQRSRPIPLRDFVRPPHAPPHPARPRKRRLRADRAATVSHEKDIHARRHRFVHCNPRFVIMSRREKHLGFETTSREIARAARRAGIVFSFTRSSRLFAKGCRQSPMGETQCAFSRRKIRGNTARIVQSISLTLLLRRQP